MCAVCHGPDGKTFTINGNDLSTIGQRMNVEQLVNWIKNPRSPMPKIFPEPLLAYEEADVRDIATFLLAWQ